MMPVNDSPNNQDTGPDPTTVPLPESRSSSHSRHKRVTEVGDDIHDANVNNESNLEKLLKMQIEILIRIDERQENADLSRQPFPTVAEYSSSAWNPLLRSALSRIDPVVDRWRGSLDVLLVFVGLFTAIVTSFFVDSVESLSPDATARTNELLANLTEIVIQLSGAQAAQLHISRPETFKPDASDVRINAYWSISLVISISAAALAVAGRAYVSMLTKSSGKLKPHERLVDIHKRWEQAERILGPGLETLPVILTIPVVLFLVGLLESIFSAAIQPSHLSVPIIVAASISAVTIASVGVALSYSLLHACLRPKTSPFRTTLSEAIRKSSQRIRARISPVVHSISTSNRPFMQRLRALGQYIASHIDRAVQVLRLLGPRILLVIQSLLCTNISPSRHGNSIDLESHHSESEADEETRSKSIQLDPSAYDSLLPISNRIYHTVLQTTHDDDALDQAAAAFASICENHKTRDDFFTELVRIDRGEMLLSSLETTSLIHLLSPEASYRCNLTASETVLRLNDVSITVPDWVPLCTISQRIGLLDALEDAAWREYSRFNGSDIWHSSFIRSFAVLVHPEHPSGRQPNLNYILGMLNSPYIIKSQGKAVGAAIGQKAIDMAFSTLFEAVLQEHRSGAQRSLGRMDTIPPLAVDRSLQRLLGPRRDSSSVATSTVMRCLGCWSETRIVTKEWIHSDQRDPFISCLLRWIWNDSIPTPKDVSKLTLYVASLGPRCTEVLIQLIDRETNPIHRLDLTFSAINGLKLEPGSLQHNLISLAAALNSLILTQTRQNHRGHTKKQAQQLILFYNLIFCLKNLWLYTQDSETAGQNEAETERQDILKSIRQLWNNLYGPVWISSNDDLLLPDTFPDQASSLASVHDSEDAATQPLVAMPYFLDLTYEEETGSMQYFSAPVNN